MFDLIARFPNNNGSAIHLWLVSVHLTVLTYVVSYLAVCPPYLVASVGNNVYRVRYPAIPVRIVVWVQSRAHNYIF